MTKHSVEDAAISARPTAPKATHRIIYVQFVSEVTIGGDNPSLAFWSAEKHGSPRAREPIELEDRGGFLLLWLCKKEPQEDGTAKVVRTGDRRRVPITNVAFMTETPL